MVITLQCMAMRVYGHSKSTWRSLIFAKSAISVCIQSDYWESKKKNTNGPCVYGPLKSQGSSRVKGDNIPESRAIREWCGLGFLVGWSWDLRTSHQRRDCCAITALFSSARNSGGYWCININATDHDTSSSHVNHGFFFLLGLNRTVFVCRV